MLGVGVAKACSSHDLARGRVDALAVDEARGRVRTLRAAEEQDVWLWPVDRVVDPPAALLHEQFQWQCFAHSK